MVCGIAEIFYKLFCILTNPKSFFFQSNCLSKIVYLCEVLELKHIFLELNLICHN